MSIDRSSCDRLARFPAVHGFRVGQNRSTGRQEVIDETILPLWFFKAKNRVSVDSLVCVCFIVCFISYIYIFFSSFPSKIN